MAPLAGAVLAAEWVAAERALRLTGRPTPPPLAGARALAEAFEAGLEDRPLGPDLGAAEARLGALAALV
jgi:hypothetical protein